jgi:protein MpaA
MRSARRAMLRLAALAAALAAVATPADPTGHRTVLLGRSVDGRPIAAIETGDLDSPRRELVVGCTHGNECAGVAVAERLAHTQPPPELALWIVPNLNPDGAAANTRQNAHRVDLNRNFPWRWQRLTGVYDSGPHPLSEPESRLAATLIARVRPNVTIWFHQHLDVVDDSSGDVAIERRFADVADMQLAALTREPGSAVTWQSHCFPAATAFVVELPAGRLAPRAVARLDAAADAAGSAAPARRPTTTC